MTNLDVLMNPATSRLEWALRRRPGRPQLCRRLLCHWWVMEGFVVPPGLYPCRECGGEQIATEFGWANLLEPSDG